MGVIVNYLYWKTFWTVLYFIKQNYWLELLTRLSKLNVA
jgi:hypothetical protein